MINLPIFRAKKLDSDELLKGLISTQKRLEEWLEKCK